MSKTNSIRCLLIPLVASMVCSCVKTSSSEMEEDHGQIVDRNLTQIDYLDMSILTKINTGNNSYGNNPHLGILVYINSCNCEFFSTTGL